MTATNLIAVAVALSALILFIACYTAGYGAGQRNQARRDAERLRRLREQHETDRGDIGWDDIGDTLTPCGSIPTYPGCDCARCHAPETPSEYR
jgi:hypothetical protein